MYKRKLIFVSSLSALGTYFHRFRRLCLYKSLILPRFTSPFSYSYCHYVFTSLFWYPYCPYVFTTLFRYPYCPRVFTALFSRPHSSQTRSFRTLDPYADSFSFKSPISLVSGPRAFPLLLVDSHARWSRTTP